MGSVLRLDRDPKGLIVWPLDEEGRIVNIASAERLQPRYAEACAAARDELLWLLADEVRAIYVRGSAAIANATSPFSDLDLLVITRNRVTADTVPLHDRLMSAFPFLESLDIGIAGTEELDGTAFGRKVQSYLLIESARLWGEDLAAGWPRPRPDAALAAVRFPGLVAEVQWLEGILAGAIPPPSYRDIPRPVSFWSKWAMRVVLRATHLMSMLDTRAYTNDLTSCHALASRHFPAFADALDRAYHNERLPRSNRETGLAILKWFLAQPGALWTARVEPDGSPNNAVQHRVEICSVSSRAPSINFTSLPTAMKR